MDKIRVFFLTETKKKQNPRINIKNTNPYVKMLSHFCHSDKEPLKTHRVNTEAMTHEIM